MTREGWTYDEEMYVDGPLSRGPIPVSQWNREMADLIGRAEERLRETGGDLAADSVIVETSPDPCPLCADGNTATYYTESSAEAAAGHMKDLLNADLWRAKMCTDGNWHIMQVAP